MTIVRDAAVVLPFLRDDEGALRLLVVQRSTSGRHGGQIALPGGNREPGDADLRATALREASEELGVPATRMRILAELPATTTATTGYQVQPYLAAFTGRAVDCAPQADEVDAVLELDVARLAAPDARRERVLTFPTWDSPRRTPVREVDGHLVWGLTLRLLEPVLPDVLAGRWPV